MTADDMEPAEVQPEVELVVDSEKDRVYEVGVA
jgi:hypothetical protein